MSVEVKIRKEIEISPNLMSEKSEGQLEIYGMYTVVDTIMVEDYIVLLIEDTSLGLWISVKYLIAPSIYKHLKLVKLDSIIRLGDQSRLLLLAEI